MQRRDAEMFSTNGLKEVNTFVPARRDSLFESAGLSHNLTPKNLQQQQGGGDYANSSYNGGGADGNGNAFTPNPQIWNNVFVDDGVQGGMDRYAYRQDVSAGARPGGSSSIVSSGGDTTYNYQTGTQNPSSGGSLSSLLGARRGSSMDNSQFQWNQLYSSNGGAMSHAGGLVQQQPQGQNYKIWSKDVRGGSWPHELHTSTGLGIASNDGYDLGFFSSQRRHQSLDSGFAPQGFFEQPLVGHQQSQTQTLPSLQQHHHHHQQQQQQQQQHVLQQVAAQSQTLGNGLQSPHPQTTFNESIFDQTSAQGNLSQLSETNESLREVYRSLDFYFTQDPHNRVTIKDHTLESLSAKFQSMMKSGAQLPRFVDEELPSTNMILVAFKAGRTDVFHLPSTTSFKLKTGDLVIVEADRGRDLGKVLRLDVSLDEARLLKYMQHQEQQAALASFEGMSSPPSSANANASTGSGGTAQAPVPTLHYPKPILRFAMPNEACQIISKQADEEKAQKVCASKVSSFKLEMRVVDAEYQWDRRKLTLYYAASHRIDFRELVRELFRIYKTRIWMCAVVSNHQESLREESLSPSTGTVLAQQQQQQQQQPYGLGSLSPNSQHPANIWSSPIPQTSSTLDSGRTDLAMLVPRQLSSPDKKIWST